MSHVTRHGVSAARLALLPLSVASLAAQTPLPTVRPIARPPVVTDMELGPPNPAFALADLDLFDGAIGTVFPRDAAVVPSDSLTAARSTRAHAWAALIPTAGRGVLMDAVLRAEVLIAAGDDAGAQHAFDAAFADAPPVRRSYVLARAVAMFVDGQRDDSVLARRIMVAERYLARLMALPPGGYPTAYDSIALVERTYAGALAVLSAAARLDDATRVMAHTAHVFTALHRHSGWERAYFFRGDFPYEAVATVLLGQPDGLARLDSLAARAQAVVALTRSELAALPLTERAKAPHDVAAIAGERIRSATLLAQRAPPIIGHAWLNTPDSLYRPTPRTQTLDDGTIRMLFFPPDWWPDGGYVPAFAILSRLHQQIAPWGQVIVVTHTNGHAGTAVVEPPDEVEWLTRLYRDQAHLTPVIALWAGAEEPAPYDGRLPALAPLDPAYRELRFPLVLVDGRGIVRGFARLNSRRDEAAVRRALDYLRAEASGSTTTHPRPALLVPAHRG